jgi:predicted ATP-dependent endonuclease of OLD family
VIRLESVNISRFRGIRSGRIAGFADVNVLVGRNNSGKSTVAEAITWLAIEAGRADTDLLGRRLRGLWVHARRDPAEGPHPQLWYCQDTSEPIAMEAVVDAWDLTMAIRRLGPDKFDIAPTFIYSRERGARLKQQSDEGEVQRFPRFLTILRPQDAFLPQIEQRLWGELLATRRDKVLASAIQDIYGIGLEQLQLPPDGRLLLLFPTYSVPLDAQGDGTRAALRCLMVLSALQGTLLILEEPESHQHPGALERFAAALCKLAKAQEVQLLLTTHSLECVRAFHAASGGAGSEFALFNLKLEDGLLDARRFDAEAVESLLAAGTDVRWLDLYG